MVEEEANDETKENVENETETELSLSEEDNFQINPKIVDEKDSSPNANNHEKDVSTKGEDEIDGETNKSNVSLTC